jgi:hypothetical protein
MLRPFFEENFDKVDWNHLSRPRAGVARWGRGADEAVASTRASRQIPRKSTGVGCHRLEANPDKINWNGLSDNSSAIHLLEQNSWHGLSSWYGLSRNPNAIHLLETGMVCHGTLQPFIFSRQIPTKSWSIVWENPDKILVNCMGKSRHFRYI